MKDSDFIIKQGWMVSKLGLTGIDLELYALVYGYTKDGETWYETNIANIMDWLVLAERTVQKHLKMLVEVKYILRKQTGLGRSARILLQANSEIIENVQKGARYAPIKRVHETTEKGASGAPISEEKGARNDITPYIRIKEIKDNKRILLSACTRTKEEEEEFFEIFFFRGAADPAAEVTDFVNWYEANYPEWDQIPIQKKYYYASSWKLEPEKRRKVSDRWLSAWLDVCNWIRENDPDALAQMLDVRFGGKSYRDPAGGQIVYELAVTAAACEYILGHKEDICKPFLNPLVRQHNATVAKWNIIDKK